MATLQGWLILKHSWDGKWTRPYNIVNMFIFPNSKVFHMCQPNGNSDSFLCPNGTVFNQQYFICDWWYNVDCAANPSFYALNEFIYQDQPEGKKCKSLFCSEE